METTDTVHDQIAQVRADVSPTAAGLALVLVAALGFTLLFLQDPLAHDAVHNFRHGAGITCH